MKTRFLILGLLIALVASCKKDSENSPSGGGPTFVGKRLQLTSLVMDPPIDINGDGKPDPEMISLLHDCVRDNVLIFKSGGTFSGEEGPKACSGTEDPVVEEGATWSYDDATKTIRLTNPDKTYEDWKVVESNNQRLKIQYKEVDNGQTTTLTMTWTVL